MHMRKQYACTRWSPSPSAGSGSGSMPNSRPLFGSPGFTYGSTFTMNRWLWVFHLRATPLSVSPYFVFGSRPTV